MGSIQQTQPTSGEQVPPLMALEKIAPKGWLRYVFPFELGATYDIDEVSSILQAGYDGLRRRLAISGTEAVPDPSSPQAGVFKLIPIPEGDDFTRIKVQDLRASPEKFPLTYAELKAKHFPLSAFDGELLTRCYCWPSAGSRCPVSLIQANFIDGGLILVWNLFHLIGDGNAFLTWTKVFAEECRRAAGEEIAEPFVLEEAMFADRERVVRSTGQSPGRIEDHGEYTLLPFTPPGPPPKMTSLSHRGQVFYFSPEALKALKEEASPANAKGETGGQSWISTNDALSALLWRTVMAAQWPLETLEGDPVSVFNIAVDGRHRTSPPVHPHTLGCWLEYVAVAAPIRKMLDGSLTIADLAIMIRKALLKMGENENFTDDVVALVEKLEDVDRLCPTAFLDAPGYNCVQTSWVGFGLYGLDWGKKLGGAIQAVRSPSVGVINGGQVVLPILPNGGMEILVGVEGNCLDRVLSEPLWTKFAETR